MSKIIGKTAKCQVCATETGTYRDLFDVAQDVTFAVGVNSYTLNRKKAASGRQGVLLGDFVLSSFSTTIDWDLTNGAVEIIKEAFWGKSPIFARVYYTATNYIQGQFYVLSFPISQPLEDAVQGSVTFGLVDGTVLEDVVQVPFD